LLAGLDDAPIWNAVLDAEPAPARTLSPAGFDAACHAIACFADVKSPYTIGHSPGVAELAWLAGKRVGLPPAEAVALRRAALLHDLGRVGVSTGIWDKPSRLSEAEWERVRLPPYYTERILARSAALAPLGRLAASHHERLDGNGYHRGSMAAQLSPAARLLAAADVVHALGEPRPFRPAMPLESAAATMRGEVNAGRIDAEAAGAVLAAAGIRAAPVRRARPNGLTEREVEVLRLLARGSSNRQIAETLVVSERTVHHHVEHIYDKIDVTTRAAAALFAAQHDLV
jgi:HD-GYP domain-containing protein (c-di-GMP phosphodiesterase class II)